MSDIARQVAMLTEASGDFENAITLRTAHDDMFPAYYASDFTKDVKVTALIEDQGEKIRSIDIIDPQTIREVSSVVVKAFLRVTSTARSAKLIPNTAIETYGLISFDSVVTVHSRNRFVIVGRAVKNGGAANTNIAEAMRTITFIISIPVNACAFGMTRSRSYHDALVIDGVAERV